MRIRHDKLNDKGKIYYWIQEVWPGFSPSLSYRTQADILKRRSDAIDFVEQGWEEGVVVMLFNLPDKSGFIQLICVDSAEELNSYLKRNEAHACLSPECRKVTRMIGWDSGKDAFLQMIARLTIRAKYEAENLPQPRSVDLDAAALELRASGEMNSLFGRLGEP